MKITVESLVNSDSKTVWDAWNNPEDIKKWNAPSDDWHTTESTVDLRVGGKLNSRTEPKDGSAGFDLAAVYTKIEPYKIIESRLDDNRQVKVEFLQKTDGVLVRETFETESENDPEMQRQGWQAILDNFKRHVESEQET